MKKKKQIQVFEYEGKRITFDFGDGEEMVNATEIIKVFDNKRLRNFTRLQQTKEFIVALEQEMNSKGSDVSLWKKAIRSVRGGNDPTLRGIWYEKRLALKLAAWLNPKFEVWVFTQIAELLRNEKTASQVELKTLEFVFQKIKDNAMEIHHLSDILADLEEIKNEEKYI